MGAEYDYVVVDIETTGLRPDSDQICEIAAIGVADGLPRASFQTLVAIEGAMPEAAVRVNGITDEMLKGAPSIGDALDAFLDFIGDDAVLVGHNIASFDIPFMETAAVKSGRDLTVFEVIDTLKLAKELWPDLPSRSMDSLRDVLGIERTEAHRALADCYDELAVFNAVFGPFVFHYQDDYILGDAERIKKYLGDFSHDLSFEAEMLDYEISSLRFLQDSLRRKSKWFEELKKHIYS